MDPASVNPRKFHVEGVLYDNKDFAVAYGYWEETELRLAMRWNGHAEDVGYPKAFGNPVWFIIDPDLSVPFVSSLIGLPGADKYKILEALSVLQN